MEKLNQDNIEKFIRKNRDKFGDQIPPENHMEKFFSRLNILYPSEEVFQQAVELRQQHAMSLGDALIAATALHHNLTLATHNTEDFEWIKSLTLVDPLEA